MSLPAAVTINADIICQELDGQSVLLNPMTGGYFGLDQVSSFIWQLLQDTGSAQEVFDCMKEAFDADHQQLETDLITFLTQLQTADLITLDAV